MRPRPKPDSSYASNRLTRTNKPVKHLLSTYNKPDDDFALSEDELTVNDLKEPATDDEPLSSSDEASDTADAQKNSKTLEEKLADGDKDAQLLPPPRPRPSQKPALARTSSMMDDDDEPMFSSQAKRSRTTYDRSKSNSYSRTPTSSARSAPTSAKKPPSPAGTKPRKGKGKSKEDERDDSVSGVADSDSDSDSESGFNTAVDLTSPQKPRAENNGFKMPSTFPLESTSNSSKPSQFDIIEDESISPLSTPPSSPSSPSEDEPRDTNSKTDSRPPSPPRKALCPMCKAEVDPGMLMRFEAQPKQRVREQQQFCASHQQDTAEKEWTAQGYPDINWDRFDERVQKYFPDLEKLLVPDCNSYYRNLLVTSNQSGQSKNFRLTLASDALETISCGYYGTRGSQKM